MSWWQKESKLDADALEKRRRSVFSSAPYLLVVGLVGIVVAKWFGVLSDFGIGALLMVGLMQTRLTLVILREPSSQIEHPILFSLPLMIGMWCALFSQPHHVFNARPWWFSLLVGTCVGGTFAFIPSLLFCLFREPFWQFIHSPKSVVGPLNSLSSKLNPPGVSPTISVNS